MSTARIRSRVPSAKVVAVAKLRRHKLKFHKVSKDGSGKCDILETDDRNDIVYGVVFEINESEKPDLDGAEGLGHGYDEKQVQVFTGEEVEMEAATYFATNINSQLKPYLWYKDHVVRGARENHLPDDYVAEIEKIESINDPNQARHDCETNIYR